MTPQQRWQTFRARLPQLSRGQKWGFGGGILGLLMIFVLMILPFLLPLGGLPEYDPAALQDENGEWISLNGEKIYFRHQDGSGEAVILLHGFGWSSADWDLLLPFLAPHEVYAPDLMGLGLSQKSLEMNLSHPAQAERLAQWLSNIAPVHLVGHDMGGNIAVHLAQASPELVRSLTLIAPALQFEPTAQFPPQIYEWSFLRRWARILLRGIMPETTEINLRSAAFQEAFITPQLIQRSQRAYHTPNWDLAMLALARDIQMSQLESPLSTLEMPTLVIWGAEDRWVTPLEIPLVQRIDLAEVGHLPMYEAPQVLAETLLHFWSERQNP